MKSQVIIITGMHRSGTSLIAEYLMNCGLFIGKSLFDGNNANKSSSLSGHHEDQDFLNFHANILSRQNILNNFLDKTVKSGFPTRNFKPQIEKEDYVKAKKIIQSRSNIPQWGFKDPRTTLFLDFWQSCFEDGKYLFLIRHPLSVVNSLIRRGKNRAISQNPIIGLKTWIIFNQNIIDFYAQCSDSTLIVDISAVIENYQSIISLIYQKFDISLEQKELKESIKINAFKDNMEDNLSLAKNFKNKYSRELLESILIYEELKNISFR